MAMVTPDSSLHLFQPVRYRAANGAWRTAINDAIADCESTVHLDLGALLSIVSFTTYACGDATLLKEVRRQPWLSRLEGETPVLERIPPHRLRAISPDRIASELLERLKEEVRQACEGRSEIYLLLSGGLDSRIVAGVVAQLRADGVLKVRPTGLTWGIEGSRDVHYAKAVAERLDFGWTHIPMGGDDFAQNICLMGQSLGAHSTPVHLHRMSWLSSLAKESIVLAGSYGDSVGRAEYSGRHVLQLRQLRPSDRFGLLSSAALATGNELLGRELQGLKTRAGTVPQYVLCEYEQQGHYMRSGLGQVMSLVNQHCTLYQVFTSPATYGFMWSIHPSYRTDEAYAALLEKLPGDLARLPWSRTNRALAGKTQGAQKSLRKDFHQYSEWCRNSAYVQFANTVDPKWFADTGLFREEGVRDLIRQLTQTRGDIPAVVATWSYLASFRLFIEQLQTMGREVRFGSDEVAACAVSVRSNAFRGWGQLFRPLLQRSSGLKRIAIWAQRRSRSRQRQSAIKRALQEYSPTKE